MIVLSCTNINKSFGTTEILKDISFSINSGERIGLIGRNGAGKTTLFKILCNIMDYDSGNIFTSKDSELGYLKQSISYDVTTTLYDFCLEVFEDIIEMESKLRYYEQEIADNAERPEVLEHAMKSYSELTDTFTMLNGYSYKSEVRGILFGLGFSETDFSRPITQFSGGQQSRISIAKLLLTKPDILLLDEPTNHLDINAVKWLETYLKNYNGTIILISHDRYFLDQVTTKIYEIENHKLLMNPGNYSAFVKFKKERYHSLKKQYEEQQREIKEQEKLINSFKERGTEKLAKRARSREKRLDMVEKLDNPLLVNDKAKVKFTTQVSSGNDVMFVENVEKSYDYTTILSDINFSVFKGEKIGIIGKNGVGKTTLFKAIMDPDFKTGGVIKFGHNVFLGYYSQDQLELTEDNNLLDELALANPKLTQTELRTLLGSFLFRGDDVFKIVENLSGGEKSRLTLLKLMLSKSNFLLLDEPTNHLDISAKEALEDALENYDGTVISISHDRYYLNKTTNKILELTEDGINEFLGNYDYYIEKKDTLDELSQPFEEKETVTKTQLKEQRKKEKEANKEKKRAKEYLANLEKDISDIEHEISDIEERMCQEEVYSNPELSKELSDSIKSLKIKLDEKYLQWENDI